MLASSLASILAANTLTLSLYLGTDFTQVALLTGYHLLGVGVAGFIFVASARVWGKRHLYLLGSVLLVVGSAWAGASGKSYKSLVWARVIQGVGVAPFEALVNASVGDLYFVHVRISYWLFPRSLHPKSLALTLLSLATGQTHGSLQSGALWRCFHNASYCRKDYAYNRLALDILLCGHLRRRHASVRHILRAGNGIQALSVPQYRSDLYGQLPPAISTRIRP